MNQDNSGCKFSLRGHADTVKVFSLKEILAKLGARLGQQNAGVGLDKLPSNEYVKGEAAGAGEDLGYVRY